MTTTDTLKDELTSFFGTLPDRIEVLVYRTEDRARSPYAGNLRGFNAGGTELTPDWETHRDLLMDITFEEAELTVAGQADYETLIASEEGRLEVGSYLIGDCEADPYSTLNDFLMESGQGYVPDGSWISLTLPETDPLREAWKTVTSIIHSGYPQARVMDVTVTRLADASRLPVPSHLTLRNADGEATDNTGLLDHPAFRSALTGVLQSGCGLIRSGEKIRLDLKASPRSQGTAL